jgi:hypothetical protein
MGFNLSDIFNAPWSTCEPKNLDVEVPGLKHETVPHQDSEPVTLISPNFETGPWIAGGAALRWYQHRQVNDSDIDVFCANLRQAQKVIDDIKSYGRFTVKHESENAVTLEYWSQRGYEHQWTIQIIIRRFFASLQEVVDSFDISVCQVGTCGSEWVLGKHTAKDVREKVLRFNRPLAPDSVKRLVKYWVYGYRPEPGLLEEIQKNPDTRWKYSSDEDYHNAF